MYIYTYILKKIIKPNSHKSFIDFHVKLLDLTSFQIKKSKHKDKFIIENKYVNKRTPSFITTKS